MIEGVGEEFGWLFLVILAVVLASFLVFRNSI
jgi:hypothetical protein